MSFDTSYIPSQIIANTSNFSFTPRINFPFTLTSYSSFIPNIEAFQKNFLEIICNQPLYNFGTNSFSSSTSLPISNYITANFSQIFSESVKPTSSLTSFDIGASVGNDTSTSFHSKTTADYRNLTKSEAMQVAAADSHLENLTSGGQRWSISERSFRNDIPYAAKGTGKVLDKVASIVGQNLVVTSALGTTTSPHDKSIKTSHYDSKNPKLDIRGDKTLADKLAATGYFSHVHFEGDHIDVQIKESAYQQFEAVA